MLEAAVQKSLLHLDLNLLVALEALLNERSVTKAAARLHRSQPSLSGSLKRLRLHFRDDLLVRVGNNLELTPLGVDLQERLPAVLAGVAGLFATGADFEPSTSTREFVVLASDYGLGVLGPVLAAQMAEDAPNARLRLETLPANLADDLEESLRSTDGLLAPQGVIDGWPSAVVHDDHWLLLVDRCNDRAEQFLAEGVAVEQLSSMDWVLPHHRDGRAAMAARHLRFIGVQIDSAILVEGFSLPPLFVRGTNRISLIQGRLVDAFGLQDQFLTFDIPVSPLPLHQALWWHPIVEEDQGHRWLRQMCLRAGATLSST